MGLDINGATTSLTGAAETAGNVVSGGLASGLSGVGSLLGMGSAGVPKLPLANVLSGYASYTYILSISAMTFKDVNFPDTTYKAGKKLPIICKSAGSDPNNRIQTAYGKYDFFIDNLKFNSIIGPHNPKTTNTTTVQFDILEPYSLGVFILALQTAAYNCGFKNWRDAPFLLTIEFRGNTEDGAIKSIPSTTRHIPIKFTKIMFKANEQGSQYMVNAYAVQNQALTLQHANLKTDVTIKGKTVQEVLQTGPQSLQAVVNKKLKDMEKKNLVAYADQVLIVFPKELESASSAASSASTSSATATVDPKLNANNAEVFKKIGVVESDVNKSFMQPDGQVNELGVASMGYSLSKKGDSTSKEENTVYDEKTGIYTRGNIKTNVNDGSLKFTQDVDIPTVINQVMLLSDHPKQALDPKNADNGFKTWWRIDTQVYYIDSDEALKKTGTLPRVIVYRVVPYKVHEGKLTSPNSPPRGYKAIEKTIVKKYDYIYTGKNTEILKFDIDYSVSFSNILAADGGMQNMDVIRDKEQGSKTEKQVEVAPLEAGNKPAAVAGSTNNSVRNDGTGTKLEGVGGGGPENEITRAARVWHDAVTNEKDMINLNMDIYGDPFWIVNSGMGNYTSKPVKGVKDLNADNTVNWQTSEVDILVTFRSPFDINQDTGLYNFGSNSQMAPVMGFNGLYCVNRVTNSFRNGQFRQTLKGFRRPLYDSKEQPKASGGVSSVLSTIGGITAGVAGVAGIVKAFKK